jgi:amino acid transporter
MGVVALVYVLVQAVCIGTVPDLATSQRPLADAADRSLGTAGASFVAAGALMSIGGTMNSLMFATPRLLFAMAENRQLPRVLMATHPRFRTPVTAIALTFALMLGLAAFSTFISAVTISTVIRLVAYAITCAALPVLRGLDRQSPSTRDRQSQVFLAPAGSVMAAAAVAVNLWLLSSSSLTEARLTGVALVAGLLLFVVCRPRTNS